MLSIFTGLIFILFVFLYEETKYVPPAIITSPSTRTSPIPHPEPKNEQVKESSIAITTSESMTPITTNSPTKPQFNPLIPLKTWRQRLALYTPTSDPFLPLFYRPFTILFTFPAVFFTALQYSFMLCWIINLAVTISVDFSLPPYNFNAAGLAYIGIGPLIGALLGSVYSGPVSDRAIVWMARRNRGFYEPEMRLRMLHAPSVCTAVGLVSLWNSGWCEEIRANLGTGDVWSYNC